MDFRTGKRALSDSSTGSEDVDNPSPLSTSSDPYQFKRPRVDRVDSTTGGLPPYHPISFQRRESQASTASSSQSGTEEDDELELQGKQLHQALDSSEDDQPHSTTSPPSNYYAPPTKAASVNEPGQYSSAAEKMMAKMGYKSGTGLGKTGQGRVEPVGLSNQRGRRGLGHVIKGLEEGTVMWDSSKEHIVIEEKVSWMPSAAHLPSPTIKELRSWIHEGPRKETINDETKFCDPDVLANIMRCKSVFDNLEPEELRKARTRSNPFETIRGAFFLNRAAMKMANMDAVFEFMFSKPLTKDGRPMLDPNRDLLYFADVCAGPGGFSEYILWRKQWRSRGFGFTLRGSHDFKLEDFFAGPAETFEPHYGVNGIDGDGDVFKEANIRAFEKFVLENTEGKGVHFMMADGGFSVEGQENIQEILSKQLYLCQFLVALGIVRPGGHFVCKVFDLFTPFSIGLVYLMYRAFDKVCIHKPNTSRPANSERYIVCKWKREDAKAIHDYMFEINCRLNELGLSQLGTTDSDIDILEIVPMDLIQSDTEFIEYMKDSNNNLGEWQIIGLAKIAAFAKDQSLHELRQSEIRDQCLYFWEIPNKIRTPPAFERPKEKLQSLLGADALSLLTAKEREIKSPETLKDDLRSVFEWKFVLLGCPKDSSTEERGFFLGLGRTKVYFMNAARNNNWEKKDEALLKFELPAGSLVYGEVVYELRGEARSMRKVKCFHLIDAVFIGGEDLREKDFQTRSDLCRKLAKAVNKPSRPDYTVIRVKQLYSLDKIEGVFEQFVPRILKGSGGQHRMTMDIETSAADGNIPRYFCPTGILLFRIVKDPYMLAFSKSNQRKYWFNTMTKHSDFNCPMEAVVGFKEYFCKRLVWNWDYGTNLHPDINPKLDETKLHRHSLVKHVNSQVHR